MKSLTWWAPVIAVALIAAGCNPDSPHAGNPESAPPAAVTPSPAPGPEGTPQPNPTPSAPAAAQPQPAPLAGTPAENPAPPENPTPPQNPTPAENLAPVANAKSGPTIFEEQKCGVCHKVSSLGLGKGTKGPDLTGVGRRHDVAWIRGFLKREVEQNGKKHAKTLNLPDPDLDALLNWLSGL